MTNTRVVIVDDNERMVDLLGDILSQDGEIEVVGVADNGIDAIEVIKECKPDVVLLDLIMPKLDGLGVMERINSDQILDKVPSFIVITAIGQQGITEQAFELGASYYILKPFDNNTILSRVKQVSRGVQTRLIDNN